MRCVEDLVAIAKGCDLMCLKYLEVSSGGAQDSIQLPYKSGCFLCFVVDITTVTAFLNQLITGVHHPVEIC